MAAKKHFRVKALVIGNNDYQYVDSLTCAINDARSIADAFRRLKFYVLDYYNAKYVDWAKIISSFTRDLEKYDVAVFYFAGHGFEIKGNNYLIFVDTPFNHSTDKETSERETLYFSMKLQDVINDVRDKNCLINIFIIDACRSDPFAGSARSSFASLKLAPVFAPKGSLIAYSTSPGEKAIENAQQGHGIYTNVLLQYIDELGLPIEDFFKKVRTSVYNLSGQRQTSWEHTSLIGNFSFNSGQAIQNISVEYPEKYVAFVDYDYSDANIKEIIESFGSTQFVDHQSGLEKMQKLNANSLTPEQQFLLGRRCLRAAIYGSYRCQDYIVNETELSRFTICNENHFVNGMLFQLYFNDNGQFQPESLNMDFLKKLLVIRRNPALKSSFVFINKVLRYFTNIILFLPDVEPQKVSFDITIREGMYTYGMFEKKEHECYFIESLRHDTTDLLSEIKADLWYGPAEFKSLKSLKEVLERKYKVPIDYIDLHFNCEINSEKWIIITEQTAANNDEFDTNPS